MPVEKVRAFLALPRDRMWVESARGLLQHMRSALPEASWTREESWHVTLKFLGEIDREQAREFASAMGPKALSVVPGELSSADAVVFPHRGPARVLGIGFAASETLDHIASLVEEAEREARRLGLTAEDRQFQPHVTFARLRSPWSREKLDAFRREVAAWPFPVWQARSCVLYESRLGPDGAVHTPIEQWSFSGGPRGVRA